MTVEQITQTLLDHLYEINPVAKQRKPLPLDQSLLEIGVMDSFAIIELVNHIEEKWSIQIFDSELTKEKFGGLTKMATLIKEKLDTK